MDLCSGKPLFRSPSMIYISQQQLVNITQILSDNYSQGIVEFLVSSTHVDSKLLTDYLDPLSGACHTHIYKRAKTSNRATQYVAKK